MYVVSLAIHLHQFGLEVTAHLGEDATEALDGIGVKDLFPILCHEDQMNMKLKDTMPAVSNIA